MEEKRDKKSNNIFIVVLVGIIAFILGGGSSYVVTSEITSRKNNTNEVVEQEESKEEKEPVECITSEETIDDDSGYYAYESLFTKIDKLSYFDKLDRDLKSVDDLTNQEILQFIFKNYFIEYFGSESVITLEEVNKIAKEYFGKNIKGEDMKCLNTDEEKAFLYDANKKTFKWNPGHGHGGGGLYTLNKISDIKVDGNKFIVKVNKAFSYASDTGWARSFYRTYSDLKNEKNIIFSDDDKKDIENFEKNFKDFDESKLATYEYVFNYDKDNHNFIFVSYTRGQ